ncbi:MmcQ/YjbR family DNA-binding protein [Devosia sp. SL43]|uniref:MmcQ/YjbR family DNA-binding protein n=1 Tax=Devosia sp. SL43 TaxID=2806348 RepID=UPI001F385976|nr:MmcQ/YjbR family DNA-binding protein [Devosia sp. SL43]UJW86090.1 MmcQ/YjbR family DNA-binding protein [Devosia sp. SL43]
MPQSAADLKRIAHALPGTTEAPHFDRAAFKVDRIYATLAADGLTANLKFTPDEQAFKCMLAPTVFSPIDNAWERQGWTTITLADATEDDLAAALAMAHAHAVGKPKKRR